MRRGISSLVPGSLAGRTMLTLLAGLLVFHLGSIWLLERGVHDALTDGGEAQLAERLAAARRTLALLPQELRADAARALSAGAVRMAWEAAGETGQTPPELQPVLERLQRLTTELAGLRLDGGDGAHGARLSGSLPLPDGSAIAFETSAAEPARAPAHASLASLSAMAVGIVLASLLVVRWITRPLRRLAAAAEDFGKGAAPVPLPEDGPREVRDAARTFNAMQARIHRLVADRTQALAAVSHDLRTPIQRLRLRAGFIEDPETQRSIEADLAEMEAMVEATLAYLRGEDDAEAIRDVDLDAMLRTLCDDAADRGAEVAYEGPGPVRLRLRPVAAKRAFANLIDNAVKYARRARVVLEPAAAEARVRIEDDGPGIPADKLEAVFEPFQRLEESRGRGTGGSGLGLTIARQTIRSHGGTLSLANRAGGGLVATVRLPAG